MPRGLTSSRTCASPTTRLPLHSSTHSAHGQRARSHRGANFDSFPSSQRTARFPSLSNARSVGRTIGCCGFSLSRRPMRSAQYTRGAAARRLFCYAAGVLRSTLIFEFAALPYELLASAPVWDRHCAEMAEQLPPGARRVLDLGCGPLPPRPLLGDARSLRTALEEDRGVSRRPGSARGGGEALIRILHFSDPHVQLPRWRERKLSELGPLRSLATVELWKGRGRDYDGAFETLKAIARDADALQADLVVCTGDLTQLAMEEEFALAREALRPLGDRLVAVHGNHDPYPVGLGAANKLYEAYFPPRPLPDGFVALDSCGEICWPVITRGRVDARQ